VRIYDNRRLPVGHSDYQVRSFSSDSAQFGQFIYVIRDPSAIVDHYLSCRLYDSLRLVPKKTGRLNHLLKLGLIRIRECLDGGILLEQLRRRLIYSLVGTLRRQYRSYQELMRRGEVEGAFGIGIRILEYLDDFLHPRLLLLYRLCFHLDLHATNAANERS